MKRSNELPAWNDRNTIIAWTVDQLNRPPPKERKLRGFSSADLARARREHPEWFKSEQIEALRREVKKIIRECDEDAFVKMMRSEAHARAAFSLYRKPSKRSQQLMRFPRNASTITGVHVTRLIQLIWKEVFGKGQRRENEPKTASTIATIAALHVNELLLAQPLSSHFQSTTAEEIDDLRQRHGRHPPADVVLMPISYWSVKLGFKANPAVQTKERRKNLWQMGFVMGAEAIPDFKRRMSGTK